MFMNENGSGKNTVNWNKFQNWTDQCRGYWSPVHRARAPSNTFRLLSPKKCTRWRTRGFFFSGMGRSEGVASWFGNFLATSATSGEKNPSL